MKLNDLVKEPYIPAVIRAAAVDGRKHEPVKKSFPEYLLEAMGRVKNV